MIIYFDVLENILDDKEELQQATFYLEPWVNLIIYHLFFQFLYSPFDKAIDHYIRDKKTLGIISPWNCKIVKSNYFDSIGFLSHLMNKLFLSRSKPSISHTNFWDKKIIPLSYLFEKLFLNSLEEVYILFEKKMLISKFNLCKN